MIETLCSTFHRGSSSQLSVGSLTPPTHNSYHVSSSHCAFNIHALPVAEQSLGELVMAISLLTPPRLRLSECLQAPPSNGVCSRHFVVSRASSESRISTLTASAVKQPHHSIQVHLSQLFVLFESSCLFETTLPSFCRLQDPSLAISPT